MIKNILLDLDDTILDFKNNKVYLAPNKYFNQDYAEKK